jgi:hypothetical protein
MLMPDRVIKWVNAIGTQEWQSRAFCFLNRHQEPYDWTNKVPEDNPEFQGLLSNKEEVAVYPNISTELPGVEFEEDKCNYQTVTHEPKPEFKDLVAAALDILGINPDARL